MFLLLITLVGIIAAPVLIMMLTLGFMWQGNQYQLSVQLLQITFFYLLFIAMVAFAGGILNAHERFAVPALTPVFLNIYMIAAVWLAPMMNEPVTALEWGVFATGIAQLLFQLPPLMRLGLMLPAIFSVSVTQINTWFASFLTIGSVSWLYCSDRLVEFPLGILDLCTDDGHFTESSQKPCGGKQSRFFQCARLGVAAGCFDRSARDYWFDDVGRADAVDAVSI